MASKEVAEADQSQVTLFQEVFTGSTFLGFGTFNDYGSDFCDCCDCFARDFVFSSFVEGICGDFCSFACYFEVNFVFFGMVLNDLRTSFVSSWNQIFPQKNFQTGIETLFGASNFFLAFYKEISD